MNIPTRIENVLNGHVTDQRIVRAAMTERRAQQKREQIFSEKCQHGHQEIICIKTTFTRGSC